MIKKNTVFVLGAGASHPYGYPTGEQLLNQISSLGLNDQFLEFLEKTTSPNEIWKDGHDQRTKFKKFVNELEGSGLLSVDRFMVVKPEYSQVCKYAISYILLNAENVNKFNVAKAGDWYRYLYNNFLNDEKLEEVLENKVSFVTFNYDVSLDGFFYRAINSKYPSAAESFFKKIKVIHVHGKVRPLPWESDPRWNFPKDFSFNVSDPFQVFNLSLGIRFSFEDASKDYMSEAIDLVKSAQCVYFLGFGFHLDNVNKLEIDWDNEPRKGLKTKYIGTAFNYTSGEIVKTLNDVSAFQSSGGKILLELKPTDCLNLIKDYADKI